MHLCFTDSEIAALRDSVNLLAVSLQEENIPVSDEIKNKVWAESLEHHLTHLDTLKTKQVTVDPFKIITWFSFFLSERTLPEHLRGLARATVKTLNYCLKEDTDTREGLDRTTEIYFEDFVVNEMVGRGEFGIGMNGLFVAFHAASFIKRRFSRKTGFGH